MQLLVLILQRYATVLQAGFPRLGASVLTYKGHRRIVTVLAILSRARVYLTRLRARNNSNLSDRNFLIVNFEYIWSIKRLF